MKKMHIISHTHWDREWYLNSKYTNEWLVEFFEGLFKMLDKEPMYQFVLDGQTMLLEDYYVELRKRGISVSDKKAKLQKYVSSKRLFMGPLYNQPDWQLVSEESLVKNLILGHNISQEYGRKMPIGWLLDNFGQISQTSQILKNADLEGIYVWRGVEMNPQKVNSEFLWEASDGTVLPSIYLLDSYRNGMRLAEYSHIFDARIKDTYQRLLPFATTDNMLILNGYDQEIEPDDVLKVIKNKQKDTVDYQLEQSNPEKYLHDVLKEKPTLQTLKGPLYSGRFISVFPGVLSARMYLKLQNYESEKLVEKKVEAISVMNFLVGGEYHSHHIDATYKKLLMNQPHDSICGCSIDDVHTDMENRSTLVNTLFNDELDSSLRSLVSKIDTVKAIDNKGLVVFNTTAYPRDLIVEDEETYFVKAVPAFGYKVITKKEQPEVVLKVDTNNKIIENNFIKVKINQNGSINLEDKLNNKIYENLGILQDKCDSGDEYNYSYPNEDEIFTTKKLSAKIKFVKVNASLVRVKVKYDFEIPKGINKARNKRTKEMIKMPVTTYITVKANSAVVEFETDLLNTAKNHLVSVLFETKINTLVSHAGAQFDVVERKISYEDFNEEEIPKKVKEVIIGAREPKPNKIFPHREFVDLTNNSLGLAVLNKGLPEFTIHENNNVIELTLFRAIEWVADEINSRLGDAGPKIFTPDAQCLRQMKFSYAVYPHRGDYVQGNVVREADSYNTETIVVKSPVQKGVLPSSYSFLEVLDNSKAIKVTGFKRSLDQEAITLRLYNASNKPTNFKVMSDLAIIKIVETNFLEEKETVVNNEIMIEGKKIKTLKLTLKINPLKDKFVIINHLDNLIKEDYSDYEMAEYIEEEELLSELKRAKSLQHLVKTPDMGRTALEAQLSAILTNMRKEERNIKALGHQLNHARVVRRVWDYIKKYEDK